MNIFWIIAGLTLLVVGGEYLVRASVGISLKLQISKVVIGVTVVSFATSAPELIVSIQAALEGSSDIALGNVIGSNIANLGLVLGVTSLIFPLFINKDFYKYNWPMLLFVSIVLYYFLKNDGKLSRLEGLILFLSLLIFLIIIITDALKERKKQPQNVDVTLSKSSNVKIFLWLIIGATALYFGADWLVSGAKSLARQGGISEYTISITAIAIGTSVPELAASVMAALRKEKAISLGNLIGSNIFNIASVLGITAMISPITVNPETPEILKTNIFWMIGFALILIPLVFIPKKYTIGRYKGFILFGAYLYFILVEVI